MKITGQSIEWLGDDKVRISTTRSKGGRGFGFALIGPFGIGGKSRQKTGETTDVIDMDHERYKHERERIESGKFRSYDPEKFYRYEDTSKAKWEARVEQWRDRRRRKKRERQKAMNRVKVSATPPKTNWYWAILGATVCWVLVFFISGTAPERSLLSAIAGIMMLVAWVLLPVAVYKDGGAAASYAPNWFPHLWLYVLGALVPFVNIVISGLYLYRRWRRGKETEFQTPESPGSDSRPSA